MAQVMARKAKVEAKQNSLVSYHADRLHGMTKVDLSLPKSGTPIPSANKY